MASQEIRDQQAKKVLTLVAQIYRRMQDRSVELRRLSNVEKVFVQFQPARWAGGFEIDGYVDVFLKVGWSVTWLIYVRWTDESWQIETSVAEKRSKDDWNETEVLSIDVKDFDRFVVALEDAFESLLKVMPSAGHLGHPR